MITNQVGLEAEFFLMKDGTFVYPVKYALPHDDFPLLCEVRGEPGKTREETIANFMKEFYRVLFLCKENKLTMNLSGQENVPISVYTKAARDMGTKEVPQCKNIYNTDIMEFDDSIVVDGKKTHHIVSAGLHVHFSSQDSRKATYNSTTRIVEKSFFPGEKPGEWKEYSNLKSEDKSKELSVEVTVSRITNPVIKYFVFSLDQFLPSFQPKDKITPKYRNPGFYELKGYGFEYRSLPFNAKVLANLDVIVDYSFKLLEGL